MTSKKYLDMNLVTVVGVTLVLLLIGTSIALIGPFAGYIALGIGTVIVVISLVQFGVFTVGDLIFFNAIVLPLFLVLFLKFTGTSLFGLWQVALLTPAVFGFATFWGEVRQERLLRVALVAFLFFLIWGFISTFTSGRSQWIAGTYQLASDFKLLLAVVLGYALCWDSRMERLLWLLIRWFWLPATLLVAFEWAAPVLYYRVFTSEFVGIQDLSGDLSRIFPSRAVGPFEHPAMFAGTAAAFAILAAARSLSINAGRWRSWFLVAIYLLLLISSQERGELAACVAGIFLLYLLGRPERLATRLLLSFILSSGLAAIFMMVFSASIENELKLAGFGTVSSIDHPRSQLFHGAWYLAQQYFPWGSGWGTYGGAGSSKFNLSLYDYLGFRNYWWYPKEDFLMDTFWPNPVAETGFFGAIALFSSYVLFVIYAIKRCVKGHPSTKQYWASAAALMAYLIMNSPTSPTFQDPRLFVLSALMFGIASKVSQEMRHAKI